MDDRNGSPSSFWRLMSGSQTRWKRGDGAMITSQVRLDDRLRAVIINLLRRWMTRTMSGPTSLLICAARTPVSTMARTLTPIGLPLPASLRAWATADGMILRVPGLVVTVFQRTSVLLVEWFRPPDVLENLLGSSAPDNREGDDNGGLLLHPSSTIGRSRVSTLGQCSNTARSMRLTSVTSKGCCALCRT